MKSIDSQLKELRQVDTELGLVEQELSDAAFPQHADTVEHMLTLYEKPTHLLHVNSEVTGSAFGCQFEYRIVHTFSIDMQPILSKASPNLDPLHNLAEATSGELSEILTQSLIPRGLGIASEYSCSTLQIEHEKKPIQVAFEKPAYCFVEVSKSAVMFDFSMAIIPLYESERAIFTLDREDCNKHVFIAQSLLRKKKEVPEQLASWNVTQAGVDIKIDCRYSLVTID